MKTRLLIGLTLLVGLSLALSLQLERLLPSFSIGLQPVYAQDSAERKFWVFDGHTHPTWSVYARGGTIAEANSDPRFTLPLAEQGGLGASFFNTAIDEFLEANHIAVKEALRQFDHFYREVARYPDQLGVATNAEQVRALRRQGKIAAILAIEGALALESDLGVLRMFHRLGVREMNLVHLLGNNIGDVMHSSENNGKGYGLTDYGRELVAEMNRLGMVIDLSHTAEQTVLDVMEVSTQPASSLTRSDIGGTIGISSTGFRLSNPMATCGSTLPTTLLICLVLMVSRRTGSSAQRFRSRATSMPTIGA